MQGLLLKISRLFAALVIVLTANIPAAQPVPAPDYETLAEEEAAWLWEQQLSNGAFAFRADAKGEVLVNPYFSAFAAIALTAYDGSAQAKENIARHINWHFEHLNTADEDPCRLAGTIFDYYYTLSPDGTTANERTDKKYDSTDSYSAVFLCLLRDYCRRYGDTEILRKNTENIDLVANVLYATQTSGYSSARPDYPVMFLMDNCEVYAGLNAAAEIYEITGNKEQKEKAESLASHYEKAFVRDWWRFDHFSYALTPLFSGINKAESFSYERFYPDAASQVYPVVFGLVPTDGRQAKIAYARLCNEIKWENLEHITSGADGFYWGMLALAGAKMGDENRVNSYLSAYTQAVEAQRNYPLYCMDSALVLLTLVEMQGG